jgi:hypothetical protein
MCTHEIIAYCDTSFLIEYGEASVFDESDPFFERWQQNRPKHFDLIERIVGTSKKIEAIKPLRRLVENFETNLKLISSVFALLELNEKYSEWHMKVLIGESSNHFRAFNKGKKQLVDIVSKLYQLDEDKEAQEVFFSLFPQHLMGAGCLGVDFKDVNNLELTVEGALKTYSILSVMQIGVVDIMHLLAAKNLNAEYFLSFDSDFNKIKEIMQEKLNLKLISNTQELKELISRTKK